MEMCIINWFKGNSIGYPILWTIIVVIALSFGFCLYRYIQKKYLRGCTQLVDATIVRSKVEEVVYEFMYNGSKCVVRTNGFTYEANRQSSGHNFGYARRQNRVGNNVKLYVNPKNPKIFMDERSVKIGRIAFAVMILFSMIIIASIVYKLLGLACS